MWHHFTPAGRLNRWPYFWRVLALYLVAFACYSLPALAEQQHSSVGGWKNLALVGILICIYLVAVQAIKRLHDLDMRGWWLLLFFVPLVGFVLGTRIQFMPGTTGPNRFGVDPLE